MKKFKKKINEVKKEEKAKFMLGPQCNPQMLLKKSETAPSQENSLATMPSVG